MFKDDQEIDDVLEAISAHFMDRLAPREHDFIVDITDQWSRMRSMTEPQKAWIERIWDRMSA